MANIYLSGITGCFSPSSGGTGTIRYDDVYKSDTIISFCKCDIKANKETAWLDVFCVSIVFFNYTQLFKFHDIDDRNTYYTTLI